MPRKAKPLRMWAISAHRRFYNIERTRGESIAGFMKSVGPVISWRNWKSTGYRAVRVTVREDV